MAITAIDTNLVIRRFRIEDLSEIIKIVNTSLTETYSIELYLEIHNSWPEAFKIAVYNNKIVGFLAGSKSSNTEARILMIAIDPNYRRFGIGSKLMDDFEILCQFLNIRSIKLEVRFSNYNAIEFYQKRRYVIVNIIPNYYTNNESAYVMKKVLFM